MNNKERLDIVDLYNGTDDYVETTSSSIGLDPLDAKSHGNHYTHVKHSISDHRFFVSPQVVSHHANTLKPMTLIHDIGYCGPAAIGFLLFELIAQKKISTDSHNGIYAKPLHFLLRVFSAYYQINIHHIQDLVDQLSIFDSNELQVILAPVCRVMLLCILQSTQPHAQIPSSERFFNNINNDREIVTMKTDLLNNPLDVSNACIILCIRHLQDANSDATYVSHRTGRLEHFRDCFTAEDCYVLATCLNLRLNLYGYFEHNSYAPNLALQKTTAEKHLDRLNFAQTLHFKSARMQNIEIIYRAFILDEEGIMGHYDLRQSEPLVHGHLARLKPPSSVYKMSLSEIAFLAHCDTAPLLYATFLDDKRKHSSRTLCIQPNSPDTACEIDDGAHLRKKKKNSLNAHFPNFFGKCDFTDKTVDTLSLPGVVDLTRLDNTIYEQETIDQKTGKAYHSECNFDRDTNDSVDEEYQETLMRCAGHDDIFVIDCDDLIDYYRDFHEKHY